METVLFTDHEVLVFAIASSAMALLLAVLAVSTGVERFAIASSAMALLLAVLAVSTGVERRIGRIESKIRQAMWSDVIHQ
jgi:hypothetical protein